MHVCYMCKGNGVYKSLGLGKILLDQFINRLSWIRTPPQEFRPFISARVAEIQETIGADQMRYIKSNNNPADTLTRGIHLKHVMKWSEGLSFLELPKEKWPSGRDHTQVKTPVETSKL